MNSSQPRLSVVVVTVADSVGPYCDCSELAENLAALKRQAGAPPMEVIVPFHERIRGIDALARRFPEVRFLRADPLKSLSPTGYSREHHDELRAVGTAAARGEIVAFLEDHVRPARNWAAAVVAEHAQRYAVIGGAIQNAVDRPLNWAAYFCDLGRYQNPVPDGESPYASTVNNSYKREVLEAQRGVWSGRFNETVVNAAIRAQGGRLALSPRVVVWQHRLNLRLGAALREFFVWGRSYGRTRSRFITPGRRLFYAAFTPSLPVLMLARLARNAVRRRTGLRHFVLSLPYSALLASGWACGELAGYLTAPGSSFHTVRSRHAGAA